MSTIVNQLRESSTFIASYVVPAAVIVVDTTNNRVCVGDGRTAGGWPAAKLSEIISLSSRTALSVIGNPTASAANAQDIVGTANTVLGVSSGSTSVSFGSVNLAATAATRNQLLLARGGTGADLSATGGTSQVLLQSSAGAVVTVGQLSAASLSDYVASTWTPTIFGSSSTGTTTYTTQVGSYERIGRFVTCRYRLQFTGFTGTGSAILGGLPLASAATSNDYGSGHISYMAGVTLSVNYTQLTGYITPGSAQVTLNQNGSGQTGIALGMTGLSTSSVILIGAMQYHV